MAQITQIDFFSKPGSCQITTDGGPVYKVEIPEDITDVAFLSTLTKDANDTLEVFDLFFELNTAGTIAVLIDGKLSELKTKNVLNIVKST